MKASVLVKEPKPEADCEGRDEAEDAVDFIGKGGGEVMLLRLSHDGLKYYLRLGLSFIKWVPANDRCLRGGASCHQILRLLREAGIEPCRGGASGALTDIYMSDSQPQDLLQVQREAQTTVRMAEDAWQSREPARLIALSNQARFYAGNNQFAEQRTVLRQIAEECGVVGGKGGAGIGLYGLGLAPRPRTLPATAFSAFSSASRSKRTSGEPG